MLVVTPLWSCFLSCRDTLWPVRTLKRKQVFRGIRLLAATASCAHGSCSGEGGVRRGRHLMEWVQMQSSGNTMSARSCHPPFRALTDTTILGFSRRCVPRLTQHAQQCQLVQLYFTSELFYRMPPLKRSAETRAKLSPTEHRK